MKRIRIRTLYFGVQLLRMSLLLFIVENMVHKDKINGYRIFAHDPKAKNISDAIREIIATKTTKLPSTEQHKVKKMTSKNDVQRILKKTLRI